MISKGRTEQLQPIWMVLFSLIILHTLMPVAGRVISTFLTTYFLLLVVLLLLCYFLKWRSNWWINLLSPLIFIAAIHSFYSISHGQPLIINIYGALLSFCPILIGLRIQSLPSYQTKKLYNISAIAVAITVLTTIYGLSLHQGASRVLATISDSNDPRLVQYEWLNIGGFAFTYILLTIYPIVIGFVRETYNKLWLKIIIIGGLATYYLKAEYMTGLMGFILISSLWFIPRSFSHKRVFFLCGSALLLFLVLKGPIANILYDSAASSNSSVLQDRFRYMADNLAGVENTSDVGLREDALMASFNGFLHSPILGNWYKSEGIGGHSYIMDFMSLYGIIGLILIIKSYKVIFRHFYLQYKETPYYIYALMSFVTAIILSIVNTGNHWFELTLLVPLTLKIIGITQAKAR